MKPKKLNKKLALKKITVAHLNDIERANIKAGDYVPPEIYLSQITFCLFCTQGNYCNTNLCPETNGACSRAFTNCVNCETANPCSAAFTNCLEFGC